MLEKIKALFASAEQKKIQSPDAFLVDEAGRQCPLHILRPVDIARHELVNELVDRALDIEKMLGEFKDGTAEQITQFCDLSAQQYGIKGGGEKGGITFYNHDTSRMVRIATGASFVFNEQLGSVKILIDELIAAHGDNMNIMMKTLLSDSFRTDSMGNMNKKRITDLKKYDFDDPQWKKIKKAIDDAIQFVERKSYIQFFERDYEAESLQQQQEHNQKTNKTRKWRPILLDLSKVGGRS